MEQVQAAAHPSYKGKKQVFRARGDEEATNLLLQEKVPSKSFSNGKIDPSCCLKVRLGSVISELLQGLGKQT